MYRWHEASPRTGKPPNRANTFESKWNVRNYSLIIPNLQHYSNCFSIKQSGGSSGKKESAEILTSDSEKFRFFLDELNLQFGIGSREQ